MKVAFLGTGIMGGPMAVNLVKAGHDVTVWNRTAAKAQLVQDACGARVAISPAEAAADCQIVWICVSDTAAVERVLLAEDGVLGVARPGCWWPIPVRFPRSPARISPPGCASAGRIWWIAP